MPRSLRASTCTSCKWLARKYPWEDFRGDLHVPAEHGFGSLETLHRHRAGSTFLKILATAAAELAGGSDAAS